MEHEQFQSGPVDYVASDATSVSSSSPSLANDDTFSIVSDNSSQSSQDDSDDEPQCETLVAGIEKAPPLNAVPLPPIQLQNPRRSFSAVARKPPALPCQEERKSGFVQGLVDSATDMVSVIWPLSNAPNLQAGNNKGVLPLRRYIEETLRRSRTSYSTLQVALYYLILLKPQLARRDATSGLSDGPSPRAMQCGRRMFLSALILASKYLQDRNYSAKAWSKMSGLKTTEINSNERLFLSAVNWELHVPESTYKKWTEIVLQLTASPHPACSGLALWGRVMPLLTPELDNTYIVEIARSVKARAFTMPTPAKPSPLSPGPRESLFQANASSFTSSPATICPRFLHVSSEPTPSTHGLRGLDHRLPTPQMTPISIASSTPAASACPSRITSMKTAMSFVQNNFMDRITTDRPFTHSQVPVNVINLTCSPATYLSPESMVSDADRSSRSSPMSSVSESTSAPVRTFAHMAATSIDLDELCTKGKVAGAAECPIMIFDADDARLLSPPTSVMSAVTPNRSLPTRRKRTLSPAPLSNMDAELQVQARALLMLRSGKWCDGAQRTGPCQLRREKTVRPIACNDGKRLCAANLADATWVH